MGPHSDSVQDPLEWQHGQTQELGAADLRMQSARTRKSRGREIHQPLGLVQQWVSVWVSHYRSFQGATEAACGIAVELQVEVGGPLGLVVGVGGLYAAAPGSGEEVAIECPGVGGGEAAGQAGTGQLAQVGVGEAAVVGAFGRVVVGPARCRAVGIVGEAGQDRSRIAPAATRTARQPLGLLAHRSPTPQRSLRRRRTRSAGRTGPAWRCPASCAQASALFVAIFLDYS